MIHSWQKPQHISWRGFASKLRKQSFCTKKQRPPLRCCRRHKDLSLLYRRGLGGDLCLFDCDNDVFLFDIQPETVEETHVDVRDPNQGKPRDEVPSPSVVEHMEARDEQKKRRNIVT